ncbi:MAG: KH domain-containing protein [Dehalococcoidia bacterium]|nr:KH domain-containing protein [Dehalococcoidia bacterium]
MDQAEASGKTVDDALRRALAMIGATRDDVDSERVQFVVLDEGRKGALFGVGARDALVRVERLAPSPTAATPEAARPGGQPRTVRQPQSNTQRRGDQGGRPRGGRDRAGRGASRGTLEQAAPKLTEQDFLRPPSYDEEVGVEPAPAAATSNGGRRARGRSERSPSAPASQPREQRERRRRDDEPQVAPDINAEEVELAAHVVDDILRVLDIPTELTIREPVTPGDGLGMVRAVIDISGDDLGLLIGRRGETLLALQYLVNLVVSARHPGKGGVSIDVEHYRHRREEQVVSLAQRMADRVRQTGAPITLEPMSAAERRLVHLALADDPELETNSIGEGDNRKVVISTRA